MNLNDMNCDEGRYLLHSFRESSKITAIHATQMLVHFVRLSKMCLL